MKNPTTQQLDALRLALEVAILTHRDRMMRSIDIGNADTAAGHAKRLVGSLRANDALYMHIADYPFHDEEQGA